MTKTKDHEPNGVGLIGVLTGPAGVLAAVLVGEKLKLPPGVVIGMSVGGTEAGLLLDPGYRRLAGDTFRKLGSSMRGVMTNLREGRR